MLFNMFKFEFEAGNRGITVIKTINKMYKIHCFLFWGGGGGSKVEFLLLLIVKNVSYQNERILFPAKVIALGSLHNKYNYITFPQKSTLKYIYIYIYFYSFWDRGSKLGSYVPGIKTKQNFCFHRILI